MKNFARTRLMQACFLVCLGGLTTLEAQNITDSFNYTVNASIGNYTGWSVPTGNAVIASQYVHTASRSLRLAGGLQTEARRVLGGAGSANVLYVELWIRPVVYDGTFETAIQVDGSLIGFIKEGAEGKVMVSNGATAEGAENWVDSGHRFWMNRDGCTASNWLRIGIRQDSVNGYWDLYVDGKMFLGNIAFKDRGADPGSLVLMGGGLPADVYVDDVKIWTSNPIFTDADKDGMDDSFETANSFDTATDDRESASAEAGTTRIQYYLTATHDWFVGQWAASTADTDEDGMPDSWELFFGLDPNNAVDGALDADGDGVSNAQEYLLGTSPVGNYVIKDIGGVMSGFGSGGKYFQPSGINNLGQIIGWYPQTSTIKHYVVINPGGTVNEVFTNTESTQPKGLLSINDMGVVVGYYKPLTPDNAPLFWWNGDVLNAAALPQSYSQTVTGAQIGSVDYHAGDFVSEYIWDVSANSAFNSATNEYDWTYTLNNSNYSYNLDADLHEDVYLIETKSLGYSSSFVGLSNAGKVVGTYSSDFYDFFDPTVQLDDFSSYSSRERHTSSGSFQLQLPVGEQEENYLQFPQNDWSATAYMPVDLNSLGEIIGTAKTYTSGTLSSSGAYIENATGVKTILEHPDGLPLTPLKINGLGHALLKITGSSPYVFGLAREETWVPLNYTFPVSFTPVGIDDHDVVVGNCTGSFGPALLSERGIARLANVVPEGYGWNFSQGSIADVSDSGLIVGTAPILGESGLKRCFMIWRNDDQDNDGMPDDWEKLIMAADTSGLLTSIWAVLPGDDADGDGLSNLAEYQAGTQGNQWDSDGDGLNDGQEITEGTDPLNGASNSLVLLGLHVFTPLQSL